MILRRSDSSCDCRVTDEGSRVTGEGSFCQWAAGLCRAHGLPVPEALAEPEGCVGLPPVPPHPVFRDLVLAYERVLQLRRGASRKGMGMYYTPPELMECLLNTALQPCLERCLDGVDPVASLMALRILDPSCGAGDFLLAAARRVARAVVGLRRRRSRKDREVPDDGRCGSTGGSCPAWPAGADAANDAVGLQPAAGDEAEVLRGVVRGCLFGVDEDPVAVALARLNLYLASGVWLGEHLVCGNALLGVMNVSELLEPVPEAAYDTLPADDSRVARALRRLNRQGGNQPDPFRQPGGAGPADWVFSPETRRHWKDAADLLTAAFLLPKQAGAAVPVTSHLRQCLRGELPPDAPPLLAAREVCRRERVLHWFAFPGRAPAAAGQMPRFDCVLGNPPWEKLELNEREWFAGRCDALAAARGDARKRAIRGLADAQPELLHRFEKQKNRLAARAHYLRHCPSRLPSGCSGIINLYAPFLWMSVQLCAPNGRVGMVVPTGFMSDRGTLPIFHALHGGGLLRHFYDFENRRGLFPDVDLRQRFACVTLGRAPGAQPARFAFFLGHPEEMAQRGRVTELDASVFRRLNPQTQGGVSFRCAADARLAVEVHERVPLLGEAWQVEFRQGLFNMTADSRLFRSSAGPDTLPLYEGRMFHLFEPRYSGCDERGAFFKSTAEQLANPHWMPRVRFCVPRDAVLARLPRELAGQGWLPVFRMVTSPTNERSFICSILPMGGVGNSAGLLVPRTDDPRLLLCLVANLSALVFDYQVRLKLSGNNLNFHIVSQLPVLAPGSYSEEDRRFVAGRMLRLLYTSHALDALSAACGGPPQPYAYRGAVYRAGLRAQLDAWFARRYGHSLREFAYILDPQLAPELPGNAPGASTFAILRAQELSCFGEFRTARLCLAAYEALAASEN